MFSKLASAALALASVSALAQNESVQWDINNAIGGGSGCTIMGSNPDTFLQTNGNELAIVFTRLGLDLPGGSGASLSGRSNCRLRVGATIAGGRYIGELTQRVSYGVTKTQGSRAAIAVRSSFFGYGVSPYTVVAPYGTSINNPLIINSRVDRFGVDTTPRSMWDILCRPSRNPRGNYEADFAVSGQKDSDFEDLIVAVDGLDLKFEAVAGLYMCRL